MTILRTIVLSAVSALFLSAPALAQSSADLQGEALLRALLDEMRLLRTTLQKNAAMEVRARTLLERMRIQQEVVRELQREVDQRQIEADFRTSAEPFDEIIENTEERLQNTNDPEQRRQVERELIGLRKRKEMEARNRDRMEMRFRRQEARLAEETARLRGIEDELQRLEQQIASQP